MRRCRFGDTDPTIGLRDDIRFVLQRLTGRARRCEHVAQVRDVEPDSRDGCPECLAAGDGWRALRMCVVCGHVGCCDSSKNRHATRHAAATGHPIARSLEPGEDWAWCYVDRKLVDLPDDPKAPAGQRS